MMAWMSSWAVGAIFVILHAFGIIIILRMFVRSDDEDRMNATLGTVLKATYEHVFVLAGAILALGGFYEVGRMFLEDKRYGRGEC